ncbi:MAG: tetratricopeptide repeat protein [Candidatus Eisenbacteria bacterium]|nr:tetratricopeptide repeat protein [Candidatus Eisenbacteria bacterium]MBU1950988.1 tetratricopeptide repeat protein [Candidatus Eisenbacteria bacterium]
MARKTKGPQKKESAPKLSGFMNREKLFLIIFIAAAFFVRWIYLLQIRDNPTFLNPTADPLLYHIRAGEILGGDLLGRGVYFHSSPLYPFFMALNYLINGSSIFGLYVAQGLIDSMTVLLLWILTRRLLGSTTAWITAIFAGFYQAFLFFSGEMLEITLVLTCLTAALLLLVISAERGPSKRPETLLPALSGLLLGFAVLGKPNILGVIPFLLAGWKWQSGRPWRAALRPAMSLTAAVLVVVLPVTLRNLIVGGDLVLTTSNGGINFYIGNNETAEGIFSVDPAMESDLEQASTLLAEKAAGRRLKPSEVSTYWFRHGLAFIAKEPGRDIILLGRKFLLFWNAYEIPNHFDLNFFERYSPVLRWTPFRFGTLIPFAIAGLLIAWPMRRRLAIPALFVLGYLLTLLPFFITARYRLPAVPFLLIFSGIAVASLLQIIPGPWRSSDLPRPRPVLLIGGLLAGTALVHIPMYKPSDFFANQHAAIASVYKQQRHFGEAAEEYRKAVELGPRGVLFRNNLGVCLLELGRIDEGEEMIRSALVLDPDYAPALRNLGRILESRGDYDAAIDAHRRAYEIDPSLVEAGVNQGRLMAQIGRFEPAREVLIRVLAQHPRNVDALWNLGVLVGTRMNRPEEALVYIDRLLTIDPSHEQAKLLRSYLATKPAENK